MKKFLVASVVAALGFGLGAAAGAQQVTTKGDVLLMDQVHKERGMDLPKRGLSMAQVEKRYGAPLRKLDPRGGNKPQHPQINRWEYSNYTVYFERNHVIHSVLNPPPGNS